MKKLILSLLIFFAGVSVHANSKPSGYETNGGDAICAEFLEIFDSLAKEFKRISLSQEQSQILSAMIEKRSIIELNSVSALAINGIEKDAVNYPNLETPRIVLSQKSWARLSRPQKKHLILHEMLPVAGYADKDYALSANLITKVESLPPITPEQIQSLTRAFRTCDDYYLNSIHPISLKQLWHINLPEISISDWAKQCPQAFSLMNSIEWDYNKCNRQGQTALKIAKIKKFEIEKLIYFLDPEPAEVARNSIKDLGEIIETIISHGGTETCSN